MNPKVKTLMLLILPVIFGTGGILATVSPTIFGEATKLIGVINMGAGTIVAIVAVFHTPTWVQDFIRTLLQSLGASLPEQLREKAAKFMAVALFLFAARALVACPPPSNLPNTITSAAACAIDVIEDVSQPPTAALLQKTESDCGITAADVWADINQLLNNAQTVDAGSSIILRRGGAAERGAYISHLQQWQALFPNGGPR